MSELCPNAVKCPIFSGVLKDKAVTTASYQRQYCNAGETGRANCKRWQVGKKFGSCPPTLLPNSIFTVDQIGQNNNLTAKN